MVRSEPREILVVANRTIGAARLAEHLRELITADPTVHFYVLVPVGQAVASWGVTAMPEMGMYPLGWFAVDVELTHQAQERLERLVTWLRAEGAVADGAVGSDAPLIEIDHVLKKRRCDEIVISSLPIGKSRWLRSDLSQRARRRFGLPTTTIVSDGDESLPDQVSASPAPTAEPLATEPVRIVLIGPDSRVRDALAVAPTATTTLDAETATAATADVVLVDFDVMGSERWKSLDSAVKAFDRPSIAVVVLSSDPNRPDWQRAHDVGAWAYLSKPSSPTELVWLLETVLHEFRTLGTIRDLPR